MKMPTLEIAPGVQMPLLGFGTWLLSGSQCEEAVRIALETGYRHIDSAHLYKNHDAIAKAMRGYDREELFLTSKFMLQMGLKESVTESCERALRELKTNYLDLFLMHYPDRSVEMDGVLEELCNLVEKGYTRAVGVSNFTLRHLKEHPGFPLSVNQVEYHCYLNQKKLRAYCESVGMHIASFRSLGKGQLIDDPLLTEIGKKYKKSAAQISLRWLVQNGIPVIPKGSSRKHIEENFNIFDFELTPHDFELLNQVPQRPRYCESEMSDFNYE
ncbi:MAG: aldo/keto reductase [Chlamydiales bacterium]|nr:aldo/keto reductase [Chlamydiales bacterium]